MLRQIIPDISIVTKDNLEELQLIDLPLAIAFINEDDQTSRELLTSIAERYKDQFLFGISSEIGLSKSKSGSFKPPFIILYNPSDHINRVFSGPFDSNNIGSFLSGVSTPLIGKFSIETYYTYTQVSVYFTLPLENPEFKALSNSPTSHSPSYPSFTSSQKQSKNDNLLRRLSSILLRIIGAR